MKNIFCILLVFISGSMSASSYNFLCSMHLDDSLLPAGVRQEIAKEITSGQYIPFEGVIEIYSPYMRPKKHYEHIKTPWLVFDWNSANHHVSIKGDPFPLPNFAFNVNNGDLLYLIDPENKKFIKKIKVKWTKTDNVVSFSHPITGEISYRVEEVPEGLSKEDIAAVEGNILKAIILKPSLKAQKNKL